MRLGAGWVVARNMRQLENGGHAQSWLYGDGDDDRTRNEAMAVHDRLADKYADKQARSAEAQRRLEEERGLHAPLTGGSRYRRCVALLSLPSPSGPTFAPLPSPLTRHPCAIRRTTQTQVRRRIERSTVSRKPRSNPARCIADHRSHAEQVYHHVNTNARIFRPFSAGPQPFETRAVSSSRFASTSTSLDLFARRRPASPTSSAGALLLRRAGGPRADAE